MKIKQVIGRQILDSRGTPTVEADVYLENGIRGRASVPSGASTGSNEAIELRDGDKAYLGKGVLKAVQNIKGEIAQKIISMEVTDQAAIDRAMIELDGTPNKARLGANAILAVSLATAKAAAISQNVHLYNWINTIAKVDRPMTLPLPMINVINGGKHANFASDIQEFMIMPIGAQTFAQALQMGSEVFHTLGKVLREKGYTTSVGDEGGYAPVVQEGNAEALSLIQTAVDRAGYSLENDFKLALDVAATELYSEGKYILKADKNEFSTDELIQWLIQLHREFPLASIEDGLGEADWEGWQKLTAQLGTTTQLVGDDLLVTNTSFLKKAIENKCGNSILVKPNQIGTLTETIEATKMAYAAGWNVIMSHRSGETEDTAIAHLAVGLGTGQIKTGSLSRSDRTAKYNELLRIEEQLGAEAKLWHMSI